jgi:hypothetical protein
MRPFVQALGDGGGGYTLGLQMGSEQSYNRFRVSVTN